MFHKKSLYDNSPFSVQPEKSESGFPGAKKFKFVQREFICRVTCMHIQGGAWNDVMECGRIAACFL